MTVCEDCEDTIPLTDVEGHYSGKCDTCRESDDWKKDPRSNVFGHNPIHIGRRNWIKKDVGNEYGD
tara:strand:+ start:424 stop:621 length:198 start_codon:yes stop_codon:yes gene_type:complete